MNLKDAKTHLKDAKTAYFDSQLLGIQESNLILKLSIIVVFDVKKDYNYQ